MVGPYDTTQYPTKIYSYNNFGAIGAPNGQNVTLLGKEAAGLPGVYTVSTYFDGFGRQISTRSDGPGGAAPATIQSDIIYDINGKVYEKSLPYFPGSENPRYIQYAYDCLGRKTQKLNPDGSTVQIAYSQAVTTVTDANGHSTNRVRDVFGRTTQVTEPYGFITTYQYDALGNLAQVADSQNHRTAISYDPLSRKTQMTDPAMGTWQYQYDNNGNLICQTDAKQQSINFVYDSLNRLTNKHYINYQNGAHDVTYNYDEPASTYPVGRLTSVFDYSGETQFFYDKLGRTAQVLRTIQGVQYPTGFQYDSPGHITAISYPDNDVVNYAYDGAYNMSSASNAASVNYAAFSGYNARGQVGRIAFGNGAATTFSYYASNNRLQELSTTSPGSGVVQDFVYGYDVIGNITSIADNVNTGNSQSFTYDSLNRLATANGAYGAVTFNVDSVETWGQRGQRRPRQHTAAYLRLR